VTCQRLLYAVNLTKQDRAEPLGMDKPAKRKPGRPSLGKRGNFTFRVREGIRDRLIAAAKTSGVSVSEEIERRIEFTFSSAGVVAEMLGGAETARLMFTFALAVQEVERVTGKPWWKHAPTFQAVEVAIREILKVYQRPWDDNQKRIDEHVAGGTLASLGRPFGYFMDHFSVGSEAGSIARVKAAKAAQQIETPVEPATKRSKSSRKAKE
jgi:hypothetical protein